MFWSRWLRYQKAKKRRKLIHELRIANRSVEEARVALMRNEDYQPVCMGGVEDKLEWTQQSENQLIFWRIRRDNLLERLGLTFDQAKKYR